MTLGSSNHAGNVVAAVAPLALWLAHAAPTITGVCGLMGIAWYVILFYEWVRRKVRQKDHHHH